MDKFEKRRPSRKQKSLGLLCQKFLARYPSYPLSTEKTTISLDEVAVSLGMYHPVTGGLSPVIGETASLGQALGPRLPHLLSKQWVFQRSEDRGAGRASFYRYHDV